MDRRRRSLAPDAPGRTDGWLALSDDDLLFEIERLPASLIAGPLGFVRRVLFDPGAA